MLERQAGDDMEGQASKQQQGRRTAAMQDVELDERRWWREGATRRDEGACEVANLQGLQGPGMSCWDSGQPLIRPQGGRYLH